MTISVDSIFFRVYFLGCSAWRDPRWGEVVVVAEGELTKDVGLEM